MQENTSCVKSQLLSLWDGLLADNKCSQVVVMGATNRPQDIDKAFLRRLSLKIKIDLPTEAQRMKILEKYLSESNIGKNIRIFQPKQTIESLAGFTDGYSGSDLRDLIRFTCLSAINQQSTKGLSDIRYLSLDDFWSNIEKFSDWTK